MDLGIIEKVWDVAVIGLGVVGLSTVRHFKKLGKNVIGIDKRETSGGEGSNSFGDGRIWRYMQPTK